jgi:helix-turn-helix protein
MGVPYLIRRWGSADDLAMTAQVLRQGRLDTGLKQIRAARLLGVSQPYLAMLERGGDGLPLNSSGEPPQPHVGPETLVRDLGSLGDLGFSYARSQRPKPKNPGDVLLTALAQPDLEARLVEALPCFC